MLFKKLQTYLAYGRLLKEMALRLDATNFGTNPNFKNAIGNS